MSVASKRATLYIEADLQKALRMKAASTQRSMSDLVNEAIQRALEEDHEDLAAFQDRISEPTLTYEALLKDLKTHGKL
jgi:plasmid stability protein